MESLIEFFSFKYPNVKYVLFGSVLLAVSSAIVGCFTLLKKKALVGDVVSHAVLPGICLSYMVSTGLLGFTDKNPVILLVGAFLTGWLSILVIDNLVTKTKLKEDTATGLSLSVFFGVGILLLTYIQKQGGSSQTGLDAFLFGKAASLVGADLVAFSVIAVVLIASVVLLFKEFTLICFDPDFAVAIGYPVKFLNLALTTLTVLAVVSGIQAVGVVLMAAMLITPAAAARFWTDNLKVMIFLASVFSAFSAVVGAYISYIAPAMPTGPWIVMVLSFIAILSFFLAPRKGILFRALKRRRIQSLILEENILKLFYQLGEQDRDPLAPRTQDALLERRTFRSYDLTQGMVKLRRQGYLKKTEAKKWQLTREGYKKGKRTLKLHRLWEVYLTQYLKIAPDHVHEDAERIEHIITPEIEARLEKLLQFPDKDPHDSEIPY